eukprot:CAMPEP_0168726640 /NCGR_PEP_ID=MMETSP0724-20121128/4771_1 /TAXON_ID=265536 /ORGANISM="Amphiprora sp., Strain CCMP467" /LENGTH=217 /DNA_ID=CAMNT_0008773457 /DNA_START=160 /DNA_END=813 /DNA_ORIENTATION=+
MARTARQCIKPKLFVTATPVEADAISTVTSAMSEQPLDEEPVVEEMSVESKKTHVSPTKKYANKMASKLKLFSKWRDSNVRMSPPSSVLALTRTKQVVPQQQCDEENDDHSANQSAILDREGYVHLHQLSRTDSEDGTVSTVDSDSSSEEFSVEQETYSHVFANSEPSLVPAVDAVVDELLSLEYKAFIGYGRNAKSLRFEASGSFDLGTDSCSINE